jgi:pyruvate ferredoxin oxidoreductase gamma subunit
VWPGRRAARRALTLPASEIAREELGRPLPNAALLAGLSALTGIVRLTSVLAAIDAKFPPGVAAANRKVAMRAHALVLEPCEQAKAEEKAGDERVAA